MSKHAFSRESAQVITFGEMVAAAFDHADLVTDDPRAAADLASRTVGRWLARTGRRDIVGMVRGPNGPSPRRGALPRAA
jgi:hypothetical protein